MISKNENITLDAVFCELSNDIFLSFRFDFHFRSDNFRSAQSEGELKISIWKLILVLPVILNRDPPQPIFKVENYGFWATSIYLCIFKLNIFLNVDDIGLKKISFVD